MNAALRALADCCNVMEAAIERGDWVPDGACDPDLIMDRATVVLESHGWRWDKDSRWTTDTHWGDAA
jgi:hypothetical protein